MTNKHNFIIIIILTLSLLSPWADNVVYAQPQDAGKIVSYRKVTGGVSGRTERGIFDIRAYGDNAIRVRISRKQALRDFSYMLDDGVAPTDATIKDSAGIILVKTPNILLRIEKTPSIRLTFMDNLGNILNEDEPGTGFGTTFEGNRVTSYKKLHEKERFVGLGEALGNLDRRGTVVTLQNTDTFNYGDPRLPIYTNVPFYIGILDNKCYGIFYHNSFPGTINFGAGNVRFMSISHEGGDADYFFFHDNDPSGIIKAYTSVTGRSPLPPLWSLGFHQSRCSYYNENQVMEIADAFRQKGIPLDCIVLDADYLVDYKPFVIDKARFPDMKWMSDILLGKGIRLTASVNPGISTDKDYPPGESAIKENIVLKYLDGTPYVAPIAPNVNWYVDYTSSHGREWWKRQMKVMSDNGISGYWNDMNEPAVSESIVPDNVVFDFDGLGATTKEAKNLFGMLMARSSYEAGCQNVNNERPFVLTRSGFAGVQRYSAVWTGDNTANSNHLLLGGLLHCQLGISGIPFTGSDIGGFIGDGNKSLYTRWIETGVFSGFARSHRIAFGAGNEPWSYGEIPEGIAKTYIGLRYRLLPYIYSLFEESTRDGMPLTRSLSIYHPYDAMVYESRLQYEYYFGPSILVAPAIPEENVTPVYLPEGEWYDIYSGKLLEGSERVDRHYPDCQLPLFVKGSSIIPMQSMTVSTMEQPSDTLFIHLFKGKHHSDFSYYEDDGISFNYKKGDFHKRRITYNPDSGAIEFGIPEGNRHSRFKTIKLLLHGFSENPKVFLPDGTRLYVKKNDIRLFDPISNIRGYYEKALLEIAEAENKPVIGTSVEFNNSDGRITLCIKD